MTMPSVNELLLIFVILLLLFGATRLPKLARSMGQAGKEIRAGLRDKADDEIDGSCPFCATDIPYGSRFCPGCSKPATEIAAKRTEETQVA